MKVQEIWSEYLGPGKSEQSVSCYTQVCPPDANCPINIDSKSYDVSKTNMGANPRSRYIFDEAAGHVYQLMKNDSYPRYLRSEQYKDYLNGTKKKVSVRRRSLLVVDLTVLLPAACSVPLPGLLPTYCRHRSKGFGVS